MAAEKKYYQFVFLLCLVFGGWALFENSSYKAQEGTYEAASLSERIETAKTCGPERTYLLAGIRQISNDYLITRQGQDRILPRACVSYVMNNFIDARKTKSPSYGLCFNEQGELTGKPYRGADKSGTYMPCVTEEYVNSVHNSLVDVADCLNIPIKELLPKLHNESGLHVNTLGPDADGGIGQLTRAAIQEVFMRHLGNPGADSTLNFYLKEMRASGKASCQRILSQKSAYTFDLPRGKRLCMMHETGSDCFMPWALENRCEFMMGPENPLRNVLMTAIYYRSMHRSATGVGYRAGDDVIWKSGQGNLTVRSGIDYGGFIGNRDVVKRMQRLGLRDANPEVIRQILVSFGFNGGIGTGQILLNNYLKAREARQIPIKREELDFQNVSIASWSLFTNSRSFWNMLSSGSDEEFSKYSQSLQSLRMVGLNVSSWQKKVVDTRNQIRRGLEYAESAYDQYDYEQEKNRQIETSEALRREVLNAIFENSHRLSLPEFMRIGHAWQISFQRGGGAPGYLTFLASKHKQIEKEMGEQVCTAYPYLQF